MSESPEPQKMAAIKEAFSIWAKWLVTRPLIFGLTVYPALRLKLLMGQPLMDSAVGNELLDDFVSTKPRVTRLSNLQAAMGLRQLQRIDLFNEGARRNAHRLTEKLGEVPGIKAPSSTEGDHIYVYYPLTVDPERRDDLRHYLLQHGIPRGLRHGPRRSSSPGHGSDYVGSSGRAGSDGSSCSQAAIR